MLSFFLLALLVSVNALDDAFYNKIDKCLFDGWTRGRTPVLKVTIKCTGPYRQGLCYAAGQVVAKNSIAQFAICYNKQTLIPVFSGHVVYPRPQKEQTMQELGNQRNVAGRGDWRNEGGQYAPNLMSNQKDDYEKRGKMKFLANTIIVLGKAFLVVVI